MTDPMTTGEIEDVLASIRKLVTADAGSGPRQRESEPRRTERLLLTPAQRVESRDVAADETERDRRARAVTEPAPPEPDATPWAGESQPSTVDAPDETAEPAPDAQADAGEAADAGDAAPDDAPGADAAAPGEGHLATSEVSEETGEAGRAEDAAGATPNGTLPAASAGAGHLPALAEEEIRAIVAAVLREELRGPLGEKITRNVRKLVRREIAQAMASLDLE